ncbi:MULTISPECIES: hypothetical protein [unclassified Campylobacter]|uniref:hypothetical protein n=1 Tax=unclassified Campylobacter TaxID=2593542 RepID=UPI00138A5339|nr:MULTISPECIES: hypothetical protein [unclassified Campylobacter]NDJ27701.1 hypothetical protein [Campylobacter sp. MIT 19-121]
MLKEKLMQMLQNFKSGCKQAGRQIEKSLDEITDEHPCKDSKVCLLDKIKSKFKKQ